MAKIYLHRDAYKHAFRYEAESDADHSRSAHWQAATSLRDAPTNVHFPLLCPLTNTVLPKTDVVVS